MSTFLIVDRFYLDDEVHVLDYITDPLAQAIEEVLYHCEEGTTVEEARDFYAGISPDDTLVIRASVVAEVIETEHPVVHESGVLRSDIPDPLT